MSISIIKIIKVLSFCLSLIFILVHLTCVESLVIKFIYLWRRKGEGKEVPEYLFIVLLEILCPKPICWGLIRFFFFEEKLEVNKVVLLQTDKLMY